MIRRPPRSTRTYTLFPYTTLFRSLLLYGHYDVQPADPLDLWETPPFQPEIREGRIWARGATDNKGQLLSHVHGIARTLREKGELPVNLTCLFEGEEEIGSPSLRPFLEAGKDSLACDVVAVSDTGMLAPGVPTLCYGLRGIASLEVKLTGPDKDLHSGVYGGAVSNPATIAARLVASFHDAEERVAIRGFYDDVEPLEDWEREIWKNIPGMNAAELLGITGSPALRGEKGFTPAEQIWARPTAEVNGIRGGYQGEGSKTVLPSEASVKLSFRLVPGQEPAAVLDAVESHIRRHLPESVRCEIKGGHACAAYRADPRSVYGQAAQRALRSAFGKEPVLIREGGSIPIIADMKEVLGADALMLGLALPDARIHSPNENFPLENFEKGIEMNIRLLEELAAC